MTKETKNTKIFALFSALWKIKLVTCFNAKIEGQLNSRDLISHKIKNIKLVATLWGLYSPPKGKKYDDIRKMELNKEL